MDNEILTNQFTRSNACNQQSKMWLYLNESSACSIYNSNSITATLLELPKKNNKIQLQLFMIQSKQQSFNFKVKRSFMIWSTVITQ